MGSHAGDVSDGDQSDETVAEATAALTSGSQEAKKQAVTALGRLGGSAAVETLVRALHTEHAMLSQSIGRTLVRIGPEAVPRLVAEITTSNDRVRWHVVEALADLADPRAVDALIRCLEDPDLAVRWKAARGIARPGRPGLAGLLRALETRPLSPWIAQGAEHVLRHSTVQARPPSLQVLAVALTHVTANVEVSLRAAEALADLERTTDPA